MKKAKPRLVKHTPTKSVVAKKRGAEVIQLAERIKFLRIKAGYTNYESFAFEKNLPRAQYGRYEKGEDLRFSSLVKVVQALDMTLEEFFSEGFDF